MVSLIELGQTVPKRTSEIKIRAFLKKHGYDVPDAPPKPQPVSVEDRVAELERLVISQQETIHNLSKSLAGMSAGALPRGP
jgi:hypothetical protein